LTHEAIDANFHSIDEAIDANFLSIDAKLQRAEVSASVINKEAAR